MNKLLEKKQTEKIKGNLNRPISTKMNFINIFSQRKFWAHIKLMNSTNHLRNNANLIQV